MSLRAVYERFLSSPNPLNLAENASLHYITTLTSYQQSGPIVRHLEGQNKSVVKKKSEKTISAVEGSSSIALEVETTLEFMSGGGAYLPGLENFVTDKIATFPATHIVQFDAENKIRLIRISWDQGSLLKQVNIIGARGNNWPIQDGKDQARLISSNAVQSAPAPALAPPLSPRGRDVNATGKPGRSMSPNKKHIKDPHASLDLFEPQKENQRESQQNIIAPRASARPPPREMSDLFVAGHEDYEPSEQNGGSPKKIGRESVIAPKGAGSHKFLPSRLFGEDLDSKSPAAYKSNPAKYNHFDLGDEFENDPLQYKAGSVPSAGQIPMRAKTNKHLSQWDFQDFNTPEKVTPKDQGHHARSFSWTSEQNTAGAVTPGKHAARKPRPDSEAHFEFQDDGPEIKKQPAVIKPRPDAEKHFELKDTVTPAAKRGVGPAHGGLHGIKGQGLYDNHLYDDGTSAWEVDEQKRPTSQGRQDEGLYQNHLYDDGTSAWDADEKKPLKTITNNTGRKNNFGANWNATDSSPANSKINNENKAMGENKKKAINTNTSHWDTYDESPEQSRKPPGIARQHMKSSWGFGDDEEDQPTTANNNKAKKGIWDF